jgi:hypothetical protein
MRTPSALPLLLALCGCGGTQGTADGMPDVSRYDSSRLASEEMCEHAVSNLERTHFLSTTTPVAQKGLFNRVEFQRAHEERVRRCRTSLSERQAACIAFAPSTQYIQNCERFAELQ